MGYKVYVVISKYLWYYQTQYCCYTFNKYNLLRDQHKNIALEMYRSIKYEPIHYRTDLSLSTIVLNSRDWSEIVWLLEISCFKINLAISFIRKKPTGMHWLGYNDAVSLLNKVKTRIFQPTANFENFKIRLYFVSQPASLPASLP